MILSHHHRHPTATPITVVRQDEWAPLGPVGMACCSGWLLLLGVQNAVAAHASASRNMPKGGAVLGVLERRLDPRPWLGFWVDGMQRV